MGKISGVEFTEIPKDTDNKNKKRFRIGIIGTGWIAGDHIERYKKMDDVDVVAAADLVEGKAEAFMKAHGVSGVKYYNSHKEMLDDCSLKLDAVSICTYNRTHAECAVYALKKGVNVLLEKPMCVTLEEALEICRAEKESGKLLSIGFQPRFDENMQMIKKIVESGELGKIYFIQTGGGRRRGIPTPFGTSFISKETAGIGAVGDIGCYSLDMVLNALGYPKPLTVSGYKSAYFGQNPATYEDHPEYAKAFTVDDFAAAFIRFENDMVMEFKIAWAMNIDFPCDTVILGTKGGLRIPATECWNGSVGGDMTIYHDICGKQIQTVIPKVDSKNDLFFDKIRSFLDAIRDGKPAPVPSSQILINQAVIDGIMRSAELGHEIEITIPEV